MRIARLDVILRRRRRSRFRRHCPGKYYRLDIEGRMLILQSTGTDNRCETSASMAAVLAPPALLLSKYNNRRLRRLRAPQRKRVASPIDPPEPTNGT